MGVFLIVLPFARAQNTGTLTILHSFTDDAYGFFPNALIQGRDGNFYGTTSTQYDEYIGGPNGTVFRLTPAGEFTTLYRFTGGSDGGSPLAALVEGLDGSFYGTTSVGGDADAGTVFRISPAGELTRLHSFTFAEGYRPRSALVQGTDGNFYGTVSEGGPNDGGIAFQITPAGEFTILHAFGAHGDGAGPRGSLIQGFDGDFYGTTVSGSFLAADNGTVYRITAKGEYSIVHAFRGQDGTFPQGTLVQGRDGNFYGTTELQNGYYTGTAYRVSPAGDFAVVHRFTGREGGFIQSGLVQGTDGNFYGTAAYGGPEYQYNGSGGAGTVYQLTPAGRLTVLHNFALDQDGWLPNSNLVQGSDGSFYGATGSGAGQDGCTLFKLTVNPPPAFFAGAATLDNDVYFLSFPTGNPFGYYSFLTPDAHYIYHQDLGIEYVFDAGDGKAGVYLYDFASGGFFYTSPTFPFPYLYDFSLKSVVYYFPDPSRAGHYNINGMRDFFLFSTQQVISK